MIERVSGTTRYMQFHLYEQFPELIYGIFTREGGYSQPPFASMNVSFTSEEERYENVVRNRFLALQSLGIEQYPCATMWISHSARVLTVGEEEWPDWRVDWPHASSNLDALGYSEGTQLRWTFQPQIKADALITRRRGVALTVSSADCVPILFYDPGREVIGVAHAGWRGTVRGIVAATVAAMQEQFDCDPAHMYAGIGPSIGPCCYEVSEDVRQFFLGQRHFPEMPTEERYRSLVAESAVFETVGLAEKVSLRLNIWESNRRQLLLSGLLPEHIELPEICTSCAKERFFSYRAEQGRTGRFPSILALRLD